MKNKQLIYLLLIFTLVLLSCFNINAEAESIRCGGKLIQAGSYGSLQSEVEHYCGPPNVIVYIGGEYSGSEQWIYKDERNLTRVLHFQNARLFKITVATKRPRTISPH